MKKKKNEEQGVETGDKKPVKARNKKKVRLASPETYYLDRLFDEEELYYTPMNELLKRYKKVDLQHSRIYNLARKYGHVDQSRERKIVMPQMERIGQRIFGYENFYRPPPKVYYSNKPNIKPSKYEVDNEVKGSTGDYSEIFSSDEEIDEHGVKKTDYHWIKDRKKLRSDLNALDLNVEYLRRKRDLNDMERRVFYSMIYCHKEVQTETAVEKQGVKTKISQRPTIRFPLPSALERIEEFLQENRWRLVDLFATLDKNKDWRVKKVDFARECKKKFLVISDSLIDELIAALSDSHSDYLNYKHLARGRSSHLSERRSQMMSSAESVLSDDYIPLELQVKQKKRAQTTDDMYQSSSNSATSRQNSSKMKMKKTSPIILEESNKKRYTHSAETTISDPNYLQLPKIDTRPGHYPLTKDQAVQRSSTMASVLSNYKKSDPNAIDYNDSKSVRVLNELARDSQKAKREIREYDEQMLSRCVEAMNIDSESDVEPVSARTLHRGLLLPGDRDRNEIMLALKAKQEKKRQEKLLKDKERQMRKKELKRLKLYNS